MPSFLFSFYFLGHKKAACLLHRMETERAFTISKFNIDNEFFKNVRYKYTYHRQLEDYFTFTFF